MNSDPAPITTEAKSHNDWLNGLVVFSAVVIPHLLHDAVGLPRSWAYALGLGIAVVFAFFVRRAPKRNISLIAMITLSMCILGYLWGRFVGQ